MCCGEAQSTMEETIKIDGGWIYVFRTQDQDNEFKLGKAVNPIKRFTDERAANPRLRIDAAYHIPKSVGDLSKVEAGLRQLFDDAIRVRFDDDQKSECFQAPTEHARFVIEDALEQLQGAPIAGAHRFGEGVVCKADEEQLKDIYKPRKPHPDDGLPM